MRYSHLFLGSVEPKETRLLINLNDIYHCNIDCVKRALYVKNQNRINEKLNGYCRSGRTSSSNNTSTVNTHVGNDNNEDYSVPQARSKRQRLEVTSPTGLQFESDENARQKPPPPPTPPSQQPPPMSPKTRTRLPFTHAITAESVTPHGEKPAPIAAAPTESATRSQMVPKSQLATITAFPSTSHGVTSQYDPYIVMRRIPVNKQFESSDESDVEYTHVRDTQPAAKIKQVKTTTVTVADHITTHTSSLQSRKDDADAVSVAVVNLENNEDDSSIVYDDDEHQFVLDKYKEVTATPSTVEDDDYQHYSRLSSERNDCSFSQPLYSSLLLSNTTKPSPLRKHSEADVIAVPASITDTDIVAADTTSASGPPKSQISTEIQQHQSIIDIKLPASSGSSSSTKDDGNDDDSDNDDVVIRPLVSLPRRDDSSALFTISWPYWQQELPKKP